MKTCSFPGCGRAHRAKGLCHSHRAQQLAGKTLAPIAERLKLKGARCSLSGCLRPADAKNLCAEHHRRRRRAILRGELDLGDWKRPIRPWRKGTTLLRVRVPHSHEETLLRYAADRGLREEDALVELALRALAERLGRFAA